MNRELNASDSDARKFNQNMILLFEQLEKVYPDDRDITVYLDKLRLISKVNAKLPSEVFLWIADQYIEQIMTSDIEFFLTKLDYKSRLAGKEQKYVVLVEKIISVWTHTSNEQLKDTICKYMKVLLTYSIKCMRRTDLLDQLNKFRNTPLTF